MTEEWRPVLGGDYEVSSEGRFRRARPGRKTHAGKVLSTYPLPSGYVQVQPTVAGKGVHMYLHRLVAEAFLGPVPAGHEVNHLDGRKANNRASNLEYVTRSGNMRHAKALGLWKPKPKGPLRPKVLKGRPRGDAHWARSRPELMARGERAGSAVLTDQQAADLRELHAAGARQFQLAELFGVSRAQVCRIVNNKQRRVA